MAPVLVLLSYVIGPTPMDLQFWPGAVVMMLIATLAVSLVTNSGALRVVRRGIIDDGLPDLRADALSPAAAGAVPSSRTSYVVRRAAHGALRELERQRFGAWNLWAGDRRCCSTFCSCTAAPYALRANSIFGTNPNELRLQTERLSNEVASSSISLATAMTLLS